MNAEHVMMRDASDSYFAWMIAEAMTRAGAEVFSIVNDGPKRPSTYQVRPLEPHEQPFKFIIFCRYSSPLTTNKIDAEISKAYDRYDKQIAATK